MKTNRSMKDIRLVKHKFQEDKSNFLELSTSPFNNNKGQINLTIDQMLHNMRNIEADKKERKLVKHEKSSQSQKNL
jgi:hypothetical protein